MDLSHPLYDLSAWRTANQKYQGYLLTGELLAKAIAEDHLPWDPREQALLPFPSVLDMMAGDMSCTTDLGNAFLAQRQDVMDRRAENAAEGERFWVSAKQGHVIVRGGPCIEILPANPAFIRVPYYDPLVVFAPPRPKF